MSDKLFLTSDQLLRDSYELGAKILESGFEPTFILGVWRGGTPVGIAVQELLKYCGVNSDHIAIRTSSYRGIDDRSSKVRVHGLNYVVKNINAEDSLLIVDDVHDSGLSIKELIRQIRKQCRKNSPREIRFATVYYKPARSRVNFEPDYYIHETDEWLVFPHELEGLTREELVAHKPDIAGIRELLLKHTEA
ncbi:MAG: phosphoribosyltransferase family protein [Pseudomonadota bacterium]